MFIEHNIFINMAAVLFYNSFCSLRKRKAFFLFCEHLYESHILTSSSESPPLLYDVQLKPHLYLWIYTLRSANEAVWITSSYQYWWRSNRCSLANVCYVSTMSAYRYYSLLDFQFKYEWTGTSTRPTCAIKELNIV